MRESIPCIDGMGPTLSTPGGSNCRGAILLNSKRAICIEALNAQGLEPTEERIFELDVALTKLAATLVDHFATEVILRNYSLNTLEL